MWFTPAIQFDSYKDQGLIIKDLKALDIKWIMRIKDQRLIFLSLEEYAKEATSYELYPPKTDYDYGFPPELSRVTY